MRVSYALGTHGIQRLEGRSSTPILQESGGGVTRTRERFGPGCRLGQIQRTILIEASPGSLGSRYESSRLVRYSYPPPHREPNGEIRTRGCQLRGESASCGLWYHRRARSCGRFLQMPNIKQQKKRVRTSAEDRLDNLRYRSTVKTITRRLEAAVEAGDKEQIAAEHTALQRWIDRAAAHGALHKNTAARKKAQAARLVAGR
jgi:small subunit ribosomal protein S20